MKVYIGCSGFNYKDWQNKFYPADLPESGWLEYYAGQFNTVEINNTFYSFPKQNHLKKWKEQVGGDFKFTIKAHRYFTHLKKLNTDEDFRERLEGFQDTVRVMEGKLGCILWQLPGNQHQNISKLEAFCNCLDKRMKHVVEFRHESWFNTSVYDLLKDKGVACSMLSAPGNLPEDTIATANTAYLRFHGKTTWYAYNYSEQELKNWRQRLDSLHETERLFVYFNNDKNAYSAKNAQTLKKLFNL